MQPLRCWSPLVADPPTHWLPLGRERQDFRALCGTPLALPGSAPERWVSASTLWDTTAKVTCRRCRAALTVQALEAAGD